MTDAKKEEVRPELWVDKYAPKKFFDLITDELQNRNVLTWLKSWDEVVFPEKRRVCLKVPEKEQKK